MIPRPLRSMLAAVVLLLGAATAGAQVQLHNLELTAHVDDYPQDVGFAYSACWGWVAGDGREYAVIGHRLGTAIYNVTDPDHPYRVGDIAGLESQWREMKSYREWIYVVTEASTPTDSVTPGLQIISMADPENPVLVATYAEHFNRSHTVSIDTTRAILICNGTNYTTPAGATTHTGMRVLELTGEGSPEAPVEIAVWPTAAADRDVAANYVHDCVPVGNRLYASSIYSGTQRVFDFTHPEQPIEIVHWTYPGAYYCHSAWPNAARDHLYVCDEQNGQTLRVFDISNETAPALVDEWTSNPRAIIHNPRVRGSDLWLANYTEGVRVLDITDPVHPAEWGYADSWPGASGGFAGVWETYPYFPSGIVIASDIESGLYVYRAHRDYGVVYAHVTDGAAAVSGARVTVEGPGDSLVTSGDGIVAFAPSPGSVTLRATKFGYVEATSTIVLGAGDHTTGDLPLTLLPTAAFSGDVVDANSHLPLAAAEVNLRYTPVHAHTDATGAFDLGQVPSDTYRVDVHCPGYAPLSIVRDLGHAPDTQTFALMPATQYDPMATDRGWTVGGSGTGDDAATGIWVRVEPFGTSIGPTQPVDVADATMDELLARGASPLAGIGRRARPLHDGGEGEGATPGQVQPEHDRSADPESLCWITGQDTLATDIDANDVDGGRTSLTSPRYDATGMTRPTIGYWHWFYSQFASPDDWLAVLVSGDDGVTWVPVDTLRGVRNHWHEDAIDVAAFVTPSDRVRVRFVAADLGPPSVVEAGIDDVTLYDAAITAVVASLESSTASSDGVHLVWRVDDLGVTAVVERREAGEPWRALGAPSIGGDGLLRYDDVAVQLGRRYAYRLGLGPAGHEEFGGETWIEVPGATLAIESPQPNPSRGEFAIAFTLTSDRPARLEVFDLSGRRRFSRDVGSLGAGPHVAQLAPERLPSGIAWIRLTQGGHSVATKACVIETP